MYIFWIHIVYQRYIIIKKGTEQTHEVFTRYIPDISESVRTAFGYTLYITGISLYKKVRNKPMRYLLGIYPDISVRTAYTFHIPCIYHA